MRNVKRTIRASAKDVIADLAPPPQWIEPELCKLVTRIPAGDNWAHEIKFNVHARIVSGARLDGQVYPDIAAVIGAPYDPHRALEVELTNRVISIILDIWIIKRMRLLSCCSRNRRIWTSASSWRSASRTDRQTRSL